MATEKHDVVVIGGGHNGLTVAAYLAKAGLDVCVLELKDIVGGGAITRELTLPGFKHDPASVLHAAISANPLIHRDELGLKSQYGLNYIYPDKPLAIIFPDDRALVFHRDVDKTCESISQFSARDAENYRKFSDAAMKMIRVAYVAMFSPPPAWGTMMSLFDASEEGRQLLRIIMSSTMDVIDEWFESDLVKIALARFATETMITPQQSGTGNAMFFLASLHHWGWGVPVGGSGALSNALAACIKANDGTIKVSTPVKSVKVEKGEVKSVLTEDGDEIEAKRAVISNVNVKQLFLDMLKPEDLPAGLPEKVRLLKQADFMAFNQALALNEAPIYKASTEANTAFVVEIAPSSRVEFLRSFAEYTYGLTNASMPLMVAASIFDPSRAPQGKHTLYLYHYEPYNLKDGGPQKWNEIKQSVADAILETARKHITNLGADNILGRWIMTPLELEKIFPAMLGGDQGHLGLFLPQMFAYRPLPGMGQNRTPIKKLYMCGASTHPGIGVSGSGRGAAQAIMEDLGIDFRKVVAK